MGNVTDLDKSWDYSYPPQPPNVDTGDGTQSFEQVRKVKKKKNEKWFFFYVKNYKKK